MAYKQTKPYLHSLFDPKVKFPYIRYLEHCCRNWKNSSDTCKATVLKFYANKSIDRVDFASSKDLHTHFQQRSRGSSCSHHLYLIQDLSEEYLEILGSQFGIDPYLFASQAWTAHWGGSEDFGMPHKLPSLQEKTSSFTLRYYEPQIVHVYGDTFPPNWLDKKFKLVSNLDRKAEGDKEGRGWNRKTFFVRRNASFWTKRSTDSWDIIHLVEPPTIFRDHAVTSTPFQNDYPDLTAWPSNCPAANDSHGLSQSSILDSIAEYWTGVRDEAEIARALAEPAVVGDLLEKICSSYWMAMHNYLWKKLSRLEMELRDIEYRWPEDRGELIRSLKKALFGANEWRRRLSWITEEMSSSLRSLRVYPFIFENGDNNGHLDFRCMFHRIDMLKARYEQLSDIITGVVGVVQGEMSVDLGENALQETKTATALTQFASRLTLLGLVFVPLAYCTSIFSMGADYYPGASHFWVYFAVAIPFTISTFLIFILIGYGKLDPLLSQLLNPHWRAGERDA